MVSDHHVIDEVTGAGELIALKQFTCTGIEHTCSTGWPASDEKGVTATVVVHANREHASLPGD
ncbi:DUF1059 domain-containing protein [bacterium]|nr:DUF1059 domain-containing protein [bacterium]